MAGAVHGKEHLDAHGEETEGACGGAINRTNF